MTVVEKRRATLINVAYFVLLAAAYYLFVKYAFDVVAPFVIAFFIAMLLQKPIRFMAKKSRAPKKFISVVTVLFILCTVLGIVVFVGYKLFLEFKAFGQFVIFKLNNLPQTIASARDWVLGILEILPDKVENTLAETVNNFSADLIKNTAENGIAGLSGELELPEGFSISSLMTPLGGLLSTAKRIPFILSGLLIGIIACFFITTDYDNIVSIFKRNVSEKQEKLFVSTKRLFGDVLGKMIKSYATIIFITFCEVAVGLNLLSLFNIYKGSYIVVISIITALIDIVPVFGTGTVLIPWAIYSLIMGDIPFAIGLVVLYILITVIRQVIEPRLVAMNVGIHPIFTLASMYVGIQLFGVLGIFILPITIVLLKTLNSEGIIHLWGREKQKVNVVENDGNMQKTDETEPSVPADEE
ncbi:MAG: sporulation integral membrane protein YtvI [Clostridia bacterium]|nr:sporulation integral membrane protein YtvI [Clostridia bacterium]